jgi:hypothetical protein
MFAILRYPVILTIVSWMKGAMRMRRLVRIVALVAVVALMGSVTATASHGGTNLIHNGGFEKDANGDNIPDAWVLYNTEGRAYFQRDNSERNGEYAGKTSAWPRYRAAQFIGGVTPGMTYQFNGYVRTNLFIPAGFTIALDMAWFGTGGFISVDNIVTYHESPPSDWTQITDTLTAPQGTSYGVLRINVRDVSTGMLLFDTFSLTTVAE